MQKRAVILGGGVAGLCAAAALTRSFERVTIVERDAWDTGFDPRPGTPQAHHPHSLLGGGRSALDHLFPSFTAELNRGGALFLEPRDVASYGPSGWFRFAPCSAYEVFASRPLIEGTLKSLLTRHANLEVLDCTRIDGLVLAPDSRSRIAGVRLKDGARTVLEADLIVDCTGRNSRAPHWFRELGITPPKEESVDSGLTYSTVWYQVPPPGEIPPEWWWRASWIWPTKDVLDGAVLFPIEQRRWIVTLGRFSKEKSPRTLDEFHAALANVRSPLIYNAVRRAKPLTPVYGYGSTSNRYRHYHQWKGPLGYLALGDSHVAFNPIGGRGISLSALQALALEDLTTSAPDLDRPAFYHEFNRQIAILVASSWASACALDHQFPHTVSVPAYRPPSAGARLTQRLAAQYGKILAQCAEHDGTLARTLRQANNFEQPQSALWSPPALLRALLGTARLLSGSVTTIDPAERQEVMPPTALATGVTPKPRWRA